MEPFYEDRPLRISRAEKRRLYRKRAQAIEGRKQQNQSSRVRKRGARVRGDKDELLGRPGLKAVEGAIANIDHARDEELETTYIQVSAVIALLRSIEGHQQALRDHQETLHQWLRASAEFTRAWDMFVSSGGISAADFDKFMDGRFRARRIRQRKHLRLVASRIQTSIDNVPF